MPSRPNPFLRLCAFTKAARQAYSLEAKRLILDATTEQVFIGRITPTAGGKLVGPQWEQHSFILVPQASQQFFGVMYIPSGQTLVVTGLHLTAHGADLTNIVTGYNTTLGAVGTNILGTATTSAVQSTGTHVTTFINQPIVGPNYWYLRVPAAGSTTHISVTVEYFAVPT